MGSPKTPMLGSIAIGAILLYVVYGFWTGAPMDVKEVLGFLVGGSLAGAALVGKDGSL